MHHAVAGHLEIIGEALHLPGDLSLTIVTYTFEPASPAARPSTSSPAGPTVKRPPKPPKTINNLAAEPTTLSRR